MDVRRRLDLDSVRTVTVGRDHIVLATRRHVATAGLMSAPGDFKSGLAATAIT